MRRLTRTVSAVLILILAATPAGCVAVLVGGAAAAGTYVYLEGELESTEQATLDETWEATLAALDDLQFTVKDKSKDALEAQVNATTARGKSVRIILQGAGDDATIVRIRIDTFGNKKLSATILGRIRENL